MEKAIRVMVVDDNPYFIEALSDFFLLHEEVEMTGAARQPDEAFALFKDSRPDVTLLDLNLKGIWGLDLIPALREQAPGAKIIVLSIMDENPYKEISMRAGADAYVQKTALSKTLLPAIQEVCNPKK